MTAVIYARYSDSKQTEQSIEGQLKVCHEYAKQHGYTILQEYIDRAQSGRSDKRIQLQQMLRDSKKGIFSAVLVYAINRFGRNTRQTLNNTHLLEENGVDVVSATEPFDNSPAGKLCRNMMMAYDQFYSEELNQKALRGMTINAEKGLSNGGIVPLGYKVVEKKYVLNEETAPIVQEIYTKYASGVSKKEICDSLNERQIKTSSGVAFNKNSLNKILKNRKYLGIYIFGETEIPGGMPKIIDEDLFNKVQARMALNKMTPARSKAKTEYILTTKLYCGYCKSMMIGHSASKVSKNGIIYNYYRCKNSGGTKPCKKKMVIKHYIEDVIVNECQSLLTPKNIRRIAKEVEKISKSYDDQSEVNRLDKLIQESQKAKENQMATLRACADEMLREMIFADLKKIGTEIEELEKQYKIEKARRSSLTEEQITSYLTNLAKGDINNIEYRKSLIRLFVNKIFLYDDKFTITFNTGDEEVTITDVLLADIEKNFEGKSFCLSNDRVHQHFRDGNCRP